METAGVHIQSEEMILLLLLRAKRRGFLTRQGGGNRPNKGNGTLQTADGGECFFFFVLDYNIIIRSSDFRKKSA